MALSWQGSFFDAVDPEKGPVLAEAPWKQRERRMYDRTVLEPRMVAGWAGATLPELPERLERMRQAVSERYGVESTCVPR